MNCLGYVFGLLIRSEVGVAAAVFTQLDRSSSNSGGHHGNAEGQEVDCIMLEEAGTTWSVYGGPWLFWKLSVFGGPEYLEPALLQERQCLRRSPQRGRLQLGDPNL